MPAATPAAVATPRVAARPAAPADARLAPVQLDLGIPLIRFDDTTRREIRVAIDGVDGEKVLEVLGVG